MYHNVGLEICAGELSDLLIKGQEQFHAEKAALSEAGLKSSPWQQIDDSSARVNGQNEHCQIVCNPLDTAYFTAESKDRQTIIDVLRSGRARQYLLNAEAEGYLDDFGLSKLMRQQPTKLPLPLACQSEPQSFRCHKALSTRRLRRDSPFTERSIALCSVPPHRSAGSRC